MSRFGLGRRNHYANETGREIFNDEELIFVYADGNPGWYSTANCLWSAKAAIREKVCLLGQYPATFENFFVHVLGVPRLDATMIYDALLGTNPARSSAEEVKDQIFSLNSFVRAATIPGNFSPGRLLEACIFPVQYPDGQVQLCNGAIEFAIGDRKPLLEAFRGRVKMLDLTMHQVHELKPFIEWVGLEERYLSRMVEETWVLGSGDTFAVSNPSYDIKKKAYALLRYVWCS